MNNNEKGMDFGKPKLTRQDVMRILRISATTLWRWERDKKSFRNSLWADRLVMTTIT